VDKEKLFKPFSQIDPSFSFEQFIAKCRVQIEIINITLEG